MSKAWDLTASEPHNIPSTTVENADRVVLDKVRIGLRGGSLHVKATMAKGVTDGVDGGDLNSVNDQPSLMTTDATETQAILDTATLDGETLGEALQRILLDKANTDGVIADGSIS